MKSGFNDPVLDLLKVGDPEHVDVTLKQAAVRYGSLDFFHLQRFQRKVQFQESILPWRVIGSPNGIEAASFPGPNQILKRPERACSWTLQSKFQRSFDRRERFENKIGFKFHDLISSKYAGDVYDRTANTLKLIGFSGPSMDALSRFTRDALGDDAKHFCAK
jgi:hypothetical protein